jgi:hypothetical protein
MNNKLQNFLRNSAYNFKQNDILLLLPYSLISGLTY